MGVISHPCYSFSELIAVSLIGKLGPFYWYGLTWTSVCLSNHMPSKVLNEVTHPFPNFNSCTFWKFASTLIPHFMRGVNYLSMPGINSIHVDSRLAPTWLSETRFDILMTSYQYRKSHSGDKTIWRPSYLHNGISNTGKITPLYWIRAQIPLWHESDQSSTGSIPWEAQWLPFVSLDSHNSTFPFIYWLARVALKFNDWG